MKRTLLSALTLALFASSSYAAETATASTMSATAKTSGIETHYVEKTIRAQDDFFAHVNGKWLKEVEIPADLASWGGFNKVHEDTQPQLRALIEAAQAAKGEKATADTKKIGDMYQSYMDEKKLAELGTKPLAEYMAKVAALKDKNDIPGLIAYFNRIGLNAPYELEIGQDNKDSTKYVAALSQAGLNMPERDYYLNPKDERIKSIRAKYLSHIEKMLTLAGDKDAKAKAAQVLALETEIAKLHWTPVALRDPVKAYTKVEFAKLAEFAPGYNWQAYLDGTGLTGKTTYLIARQSSYLQGIAKLLQDQPLESWKTYFEWQVLKGNARLLDTQFDEENFAFSSTALTGTKQQQARWKRAVGTTSRVLGESVGKQYVETYFPAENKVRMEGLVGNLMKAFEQSIDKLDWMGPATKKEAHAKLSKFVTKIGYPNKWRDYSALEIKADDLVGNVRRSTAFEFDYELNKLGKPINRSEWGMFPHTVNAYYSAEMNEIVFPAAILQPPFFDAKADDAVNYGAIGAVIGHEISHGFDDEGSQYDGDGNLRDWWTKQDRKNFSAKAKMLVKQYNAYSPVPGYHVNGELTLGENIGDNSGLAIAFKAYKLSLGGKPAPVIDGLTGDQRFYMGFAQVWRGKMRDELTIALVKSNPHAPSQFRANGTVKNQPGFYEAFGIKKGDKMYLPPKERVIMW